MYQLRVRLEHDMPFSDLSKKIPEAYISRWCNLQVDVLEIQADSIEKVEAYVKDSLTNLSATPIHIARFDNAMEVVVKCKCAMENSSIAIAEASGCIPVMPVTYREGYEYLKVVSFDRKHVQDLIDNLMNVAKVKVEDMGSLAGHSARSAMTVSLDNIFGSLTLKQLSAVVQALERGYYNLPKRNVSIEEMARTAGLSTSTFEEHLRKAETKLMLAMRPYARIAYISRSKEEGI
ncbi:MAG: helix-turn-helix domain-containing protein [Conexivisphaerales archaeon]